MLRIEEIGTSVLSLFMGRGYVSLAVFEWKAKHALRYHTLRILDGCHLKDALASLYD